MTNIRSVSQGGTLQFSWFIKLIGYFDRSTMNRHKPTKLSAVSNLVPCFSMFLRTPNSFSTGHASSKPETSCKTPGSSKPTLASTKMWIAGYHSNTLGYFLMIYHDLPHTSQPIFVSDYAGQISPWIYPQQDQKKSLPKIYPVKNMYGVW